jgi:hypothetical protein
MSDYSNYSNYSDYSNYSNYKIKLTDSFDYDKIKFNYNPKKLYTNKRTIIIPLSKTMNCVKNDNNYDCEIIEYSLRLCLKESI